MFGWKLWDLTYKAWLGDDKFNIKKGGYCSELHG